MPLTWVDGRVHAASGAVLGSLGKGLSYRMNRFG
jgi:hypothetical protein